MSVSLTPGVYRHYKGPLYRVYEVASHSETQEKLVVYRCLYGNYDLWVRPLSMFLGDVEVDGERVDRFSLIKDASECEGTKNLACDDELSQTTHHQNAAFK